MRVVTAGTGTIQNDEGVPTLAIGDLTAAEGDAGITSFVFTVTLSGLTAQTVKVDYATADGSATAGADYTSTGGAIPGLGAAKRGLQTAEDEMGAGARRRVSCLGSAREIPVPRLSLPPASSSKAPIDGFSRPAVIPGSIRTARRGVESPKSLRETNSE